MGGFGVKWVKIEVFWGFLMGFNGFLGERLGKSIKISD